VAISNKTKTILPVATGRYTVLANKPFT